MKDKIAKKITKRAGAKKSRIAKKIAPKKVVKALGLRRINHTKTHADNNCIRGMINKVKHMVSYELVKG